MTTQALDAMTLTGTFLCTVDIELEGDGPLAIGKSPWRNRRVSNIGGGRFEGPRLKGTVLRSGADWSELGDDGTGTPTTLLDVRSLWQTDDGALIYVVYTGRLVIPPAVLNRFRDPATTDSVDPSEYYFRTLPTFETAAPELAWLNNAVAVGLGQRTADGVCYRVFTVD